MRTFVLQYKFTCRKTVEEDDGWLKYGDIVNEIPYCCVGVSVGVSAGAGAGFVVCW